MNQNVLEIERKKALLVGINKYIDSSIRTLQYSINDVKSLFDILTDSRRGGFEKNDTRLLIDDSEEINKPNRSNLMSAIKSLAESASSRDLILFFFSGHGIEHEERLPYLLPLDSRINVLGETAVPISWIKEIMIKSDARAKILVLDACHAGALVGKAESGQMTKGFSEAILATPEGFAVLSSCKLNEISYEWPEKEHGVFTYYLTQGLLGYGDLDSDGSVTISELNRYVSDKVKSWAFGAGVQQSPTLVYTVSGDIVLTSVPEPLKEPKPVVFTGKSPKEYVKAISLRPVGYIGVGEFCGFLLNYYDLSQISQGEGKYTFPEGNFTHPQGLQDLSELVFRYNPENWELVDKIVKQSAKQFAWRQVRYFIKAKLDAEKLLETCKNQDMKISHWLPGEPFRVKVSAKGWGREGIPADIDFSNLQDDGCLISIEQSTFDSSSEVFRFRKELEEEFYDKVSPENVMKFLEKCLIDLTTEENKEFKLVLEGDRSIEL